MDLIMSILIVGVMAGFSEELFLGEGYSGCLLHPD